MDFRITTPSFADGADIPLRHTCDGDDRSPRLAWSDPPAGTQSFALIVDDPDAPGGTFTHWVLYNIPAEAREIGQGGSAGTAGTNGFGRTRYSGPCPPPGDSPHRYRFTLYALDQRSLQARKGTREEIEAQMGGHVLASAQVAGRYRRQPGR
jgi:Raf kinase inhibitor-like YbhB/YbcL family protein